MASVYSYGALQRGRGPEHIPLRRVDWLQDAACAGVEPDVFFPPSTPNPVQQARFYAPALRICKDCPVVAECRADADSWESSGGYVYGVRGGETPRERNRRRAGLGRLASVEGGA